MRSEEKVGEKNSPFKKLQPKRNKLKFHEGVDIRLHSERRHLTKSSPNVAACEETIANLNEEISQLKVTSFHTTKIA